MVFRLWEANKDDNVNIQCTNLSFSKTQNSLDAVDLPNVLEEKHLSRGRPALSLPKTSSEFGNVRIVA